ncbi:MAG TPA: hypothetical protein VGI00_08150 [Streptosporangiaceae bacterium]|jgi:hypothetical protein
MENVTGDAARHDDGRAAQPGAGMVTAADVANRTGVSREAVRLWATGRRGRNSVTGKRCANAAQHVLATADRVLAARDALRTEPVDSARRELGRLLQDA